jgi:hypothetical protein
MKRESESGEQSQIRVIQIKSEGGLHTSFLDLLRYARFFCHGV